MSISRTFVVYVVRCLVNGKLYVGKSTTGIDRWSEHVSDARRGKRKPLAMAIRAYGASVFEFNVHATFTTEAAAFDGERALIASFGCKAPNGYNLTDGGEGPTGTKRSAETKAKHAAIMRERWSDPEHRARMIAVHRGKKRPPETGAKIAAKAKGRKPSDDARAKMSKAQTGRVHTEETRAKMAASHVGRPINHEALAKMHAANVGRIESAETRAKKSAALRGRPHSAEHTAKIAASHRGKHHTDETKAKISAARRGMKLSPETVEKIAAANRGRTFSVEARARMAAGMRASWERRRAERERGEHDGTDSELRADRCKGSEGA